MSNSRKVLAARRALVKIGCPVMDKNWSRAAFFEISAESGKDAPNGYPWADYNLALDEMPFGVNKRIEEILTKNGLYAEWINPGVLGVYTA